MLTKDCYILILVLCQVETVFGVVTEPDVAVIVIQCLFFYMLILICNYLVPQIDVLGRLI